MEYRINVFEDLTETIIGRVRYNSCLDYWDGRDWSNGGVGRHKGLTKLKDGRYVLIHGTDWLGEKDFGKVITSDQALTEILKSGNSKILNMKKWKELKLLADKLPKETE